MTKKTKKEKEVISVGSGETISFTYPPHGAGSTTTTSGTLAPGTYFPKVSGGWVSVSGSSGYPSAPIPKTPPAPPSNKKPRRLLIIALDEDEKSMWCTQLLPSNLEIRWDPDSPIPLLALEGYLDDDPPFTDMNADD